MAESDYRAEMMDSAARHIADRLAISYPFAMRKLKQYMMEKAITGGTPVLDSDIPEFAAEVVNVEISEYGRQVVRSRPKVASEAKEDEEPGLVSAIHYRDLQRQNTRLQREVENLRSVKEQLTQELRQTRSLADTAAGEAEGLCSSLEVVTEALLKRVGRVYMPLASKFIDETQNEVQPQ